MIKISPKKVVLISSGQPSLNPRLVKEADTLYRNKYDVTVIYQYWNEWATKYDEELLSKKGWKAIKVGGDPRTNLPSYYFSRLNFKIGYLFARIFGFRLGIPEMAIGRCTGLLYKEAIRHNAHLYIAHNLAALPCAVKAAKNKHSKCGFDAEDFHRNEISNDPDNFNVRLNTFLEKKYLPQLDYLTTSSPLINARYKADLSILFPVVILNTFPKTNRIIPSIQDKNSPLKLFWFSQTIGPNRGIEEIIKALQKFKAGKVELHLLGNFDESIIDHFTQKNSMLKKIINFYKPIKPDQIFDFASQFDVGMATEIGYPYNRDICLTNKIFTYIQSGLALIASDTQAQRLFLEQHPNVGLRYSKNNADELYYTIKYYHDNRDILKKVKAHNFEFGQNELNWETESLKFTKLIESVLH